MRPTSRKILCQRVAIRTAMVASAAVQLLNPVFNPAPAQDSRVRDEIMSRMLPRIESGRLWENFSMLGDPNRAALGITMSDGHRSDTLGVLVSEITPGGPADKAGIKEGARITAVNGVNLRIAADDAGDPELSGLGQRRLQREMAKAKPGDVVELRVSTGSASQTVQVKTVSAGELNTSRMRSGPYVRPTGAEKRVSLGISIESSGNSRDTLGLFISSVITDGPAEKAGVFEGDRIAAINGVDVRVPREDAQDAQSSMARVNRFKRELAKLAPGDKATLRVYGGGRYREVQVTTGNGAELGVNGFILNFGDGAGFMNSPRAIVRPPVSGTVKKVSPAVIRRSGLR